MTLRALTDRVGWDEAVVPVVAFWGCWVGAGSVTAMGFAGGEVLLVRRAWWQRRVPLVARNFCRWEERGEYS